MSDIFGRIILNVEINTTIGKAIIPFISYYVGNDILNVIRIRSDEDIKRIDLRPKEVENKERFGDWEADTIVGAKRQGYLLVLTERLTKFTLITKLCSINDRKKRSSND